MALAAAGEIFGSVPCVVEDIEFEKFLALDEKEACSAQVEFDIASSGLEIHAGAQASGEGWESYARGFIRNEAGPRRTASTSREFARALPIRLMSRTIINGSPMLGTIHAPPSRVSRS